ncbi:MAG TPA: hypothetical protein OIM28_04170 [Clostridiaceae bacterium]|nr:hypothetical protein [Clostridiaceae bacterium]
MKTYERSASKLKMEMVYVNRLSICLLHSYVSLLYFYNYISCNRLCIYKSNTDLHIMGDMSEREEKSNEVTKQEIYS